MKIVRYLINLTRKTVILSVNKHYVTNESYNTFQIKQQ